MSEDPPATNTKLCGLCNDNISKYCCPRCEVLYCSLDCYKSDKHLSCSESFYEECVTTELASLQPDDESKQKMIEILKRMRGGDDELQLDDEVNLEDLNEDDDSDDNDDQDLEDRVKDLNLDDADAVWNALTEDERNEFEALLNQGDIGSILPQWVPWWMYSKDATLVQDLENDEEEAALKKCPQIIDVADFSALNTVKPSPAIRYNITNVLASYAFIMRYFNGEQEPVEWTMYLLNICANLDTNTNFEDAAIAVESVKQKCLQSNLIETDGASLDVMKRDTFFLLQGPSEANKLYYCRAALSHIQMIISQAKANVKAPKSNTKTTKLNCAENKKTFSKIFPNSRGDYLPKIETTKLKKCIKKVEFYLSFVQSFGMDYDQ